MTDRDHFAAAMLRERGTPVPDNCVAGNHPEIECPVTELPKEKRAEVSTATLIDRLRDRCYASPDPLLELAAAELARLRGEVTLWRSAATLTTEERRVMAAAVADLAGCETGRRLRHLYERLTHEVLT